MYQAISNQYLKRLSPTDCEPDMRVMINNSITLVSFKRDWNYGLGQKIKREKIDGALAAICKTD